jgi:hypothetical protein
MRITKIYARCFVTYLKNFMTVLYGFLGFDTMYILWKMLRNVDIVNNSWFRTFAMFWMLHAFFRVIPWCLKAPTCLWRWNRQSVTKRWRIKFRRQGITQKKAHNLVNNVILMMYKLLTHPGIQMGPQCKPLPAPPCGYTSNGWLVQFTWQVPHSVSPYTN